MTYRPELTPEQIELKQAAALMGRRGADRPIIFFTPTSAHEDMLFNRWARSSDLIVFDEYPPAVSEDAWVGIDPGGIDKFAKVVYTFEGKIKHKSIEELTKVEEQKYDRGDDPEQPEVWNSMTERQHRQREKTLARKGRRVKL